MSADPFDWWDHLEGGAIAQQRPAPPGANDPYQPVELMPSRPAPIDPTIRRNIANGLATDQAVAEAIGAEGPLAVKTTPNSGPGAAAPGAAPPLVAHPPTLPKPPDLPPADPNAATASLATPDAPPAPPASPAVAAPVPAAKPAAKPGGLPAPSTPTVATGPLPPVLAGPLPAIPAGPPALPPLPEGFTPPDPLPDVSQMVTTLWPAFSQPVTFRTGQATLSAASIQALRALVAARAGRMIRVIGRGEAASIDPAAQAAALKLALARADAIADALKKAGLPPSAMRVTVEPFGRGGAALLIS